MKTIEVLDRQFCVGCSVCAQVCPKKAIHMEEDEEGFLYPRLDKTKCVACGLCHQKCSALHNTLHNTEHPACYAAMASDEVRLNSSSGGVFYHLAKEFLSDPDGVVVGAAYKNGFKEVGHILVTSMDELPKLQSSKYVQSDLSDIFQGVLKSLNEGKKVLFSGCPCQVASLYQYLPKKYEKLVTVDLICHGVPSPGIYRSYVEGLGKKLTGINMRDKTAAGWGQYTALYFEDNTSCVKAAWEDDWKEAFLQHYCLRLSCHSCRYCTTNRQGDISLGDFWGIGKYDPQWDDKKGTSLVLVNSEKGNILWKKISSCLQKAEFPLEYAKANNSNMNHNPPGMNPGRNRFMAEWKKERHFASAWEKIKNQKFDVGILGWWYYENYGAALTAYGLKRGIEKLGYTVVLIDEPVEKHGSAKDAMNRKVRRFAAKYAESIQVEKLADMITLNDYCDTFVSGSDQMWNPILKFISGWEYYLDFADEDKRKLSYASSFGDMEAIELSEKDYKKTKELLYRFDGISVREDFGKKILKENFNIEALQVVDPVFLCDAKEYLLLKPVYFTPPEKPYLLAYLGKASLSAKMVIEKIAEEKGLEPVIIFDASPDRWEQNRENLQMDAFVRKDVEVTDFIHYMNGADYVVTDTFHGTCFAIIFEKPFCALFTRSDHHRQISLLRMTGLQERVLHINEDVDQNPVILHPVDYQKVNEILAEKTEESIYWLKKMLKKKPKRMQIKNKLRIKMPRFAKRGKRLLRGFFVCLKEHGFVYTAKRVYAKGKTKMTRE